MEEFIEGDFEVVEDQAKRDQPKGGLNRAKLKSIAEVIQDARKTSDAVEKILMLPGKGMKPVGALV